MLAFKTGDTYASRNQTKILNYYLKIRGKVVDSPDSFKINHPLQV